MNDEIEIAFKLPDDKDFCKRLEHDLTAKDLKAAVRHILRVYYSQYDYVKVIVHIQKSNFNCEKEAFKEERCFMYFELQQEDGSLVDYTYRILATLSVLDWRPFVTYTGRIDVLKMVEVL